MHRHSATWRAARRYRFARRHKEIDDEISISIVAPQARKLEFSCCRINKVRAEQRSDVVTIRCQRLQERKRPVVRKIEIRGAVGNDPRTAGATDQ